MKFFQGIIQFLFPIYCVGCKKEGNYACKKCASSFLPAHAGENEWITSIFSYQDPRVRSLIKILKFKNGKRVAKVFAPYIREAFDEFIGGEGALIAKNNILVIPIPLSKNGYKKRGYNQAELLLKESFLNSGIRDIGIRTDILRKTKETIAQTDMKRRSERMKNITDCFSVSAKDKDVKKTVIIFDDVTTTGATLSSARKALKEAGFRKVYAITVAH